jgi:mannose-6-phosphate isomerase-like protein (cupin superfamily)
MFRATERGWGERSNNMSLQPLIVKRGTGETLNALGANITFLCQAADAWSLMHLSAPRDVGPPPHEHDFAEAYYVLAGSLRLTVGDQEVVLEAGDFVHVPGGTVHGFRGASDVETQLLIFQAPGDAGDFFRDVAREVTNIPADLRNVPAIGARHGIRFPPSACHNPPD